MFCTSTSNDPHEHILTRIFNEDVLVKCLWGTLFFGFWGVPPGGTKHPGANEDFGILGAFDALKVLPRVICWRRVANEATLMLR